MAQNTLAEEFKENVTLIGSYKTRHEGCASLALGTSIQRFRQPQQSLERELLQLAEHRLPIYILPGLFAGPATLSVGMRTLSRLLLLGFVHLCVSLDEQEPLISTPFPHLLIRVAALGDSYSAGLGSGKFLSDSEDGRDNACARMDGSYPWLLSKLNPFHIGQGHLPSFVSCSGNLLEDIDGQIERLGGKKFDIITLSISGNDFKFGQVVVRGDLFDTIEMLTMYL